MSSKIIIYNPHNSFFGTTVWNIITRKPTTEKVTFIRDILSTNNVYVLFDTEFNNSSIDFINKIFPKFIRKIFTNIEFFLWCRLHNVEYKLIKFIKKSDEINVSDVTFISLFYLKEKNSLHLNKGKKLIYASHYFYNASVLKKIINKTSNIFFVAESNLSHESDFFKSLYNTDHQTYILPFQFKERFKNIKKWDLRDEKCLALGTTHSLPYCPETKDYIDFFNVRTWHYNREEIYNNKNRLKGLMNIKIERYEENLKTKKNKLLMYIQNIFYLGRQNIYHSFDIVKEFNEHKIFIAPEERAFLPSINFVEGMACGCAYIGIVSKIYEDLGLISGKHYIGYDGTMKDLKAKLIYYKNNNDELRKISQTGYEFVLKNFNKEFVKNNFINDLNRFISSNVLISSFKKCK